MNWSGVRIPPKTLGELAQLVERGLCKADVRSSSLLFSMELWFLIIPYSSTAEQRAVNSKVPRSNRGGGVGVLGLQKCPSGEIGIHA